MAVKTRREKEKEQRKMDILDTARSMLLEKGYNRISIRQIASLTELGVGTIYSYFDSKEDIFASLSEEVFELLLVKLIKAGEGTADPVEKIWKMGRALLEFSENNRTYYDFIDYFITYPEKLFPEKIKERVDLYGSKILFPIKEAITAGIELGVFKNIDPGVYSVIFIGNLQGIIHFRKIENTILKGYSFSKIFDKSIENYLQGISS